jgi:predicted nucleic acid-binding protein
MAADMFNVRLLRDQLDKGEAEALIQAQEKHAAFFIGDERRARAIATSMGRRAVGTLRVLARLNLEGRAPELPGLVRILRRDPSTFAPPRRLYARRFALAVEPI